jgi:hypothetical protein
MRVLAACAVAPLLIGCTHVRVVDLGDGRYALTVATASEGYAGSHEQAVEEANDYCARSGQGAVIESFDDKPAAGLEGQHASSVTFRCTASSRPDRF